jgi:trehalose/maltose transport system permease protein
VTLPAPRAGPPARSFRAAGFDGLRTPRRAVPASRRRRDRSLALVLLAPSLALLGVVTLYPALDVLWLSLERRVPVFAIDRFVGLANYVFLARDPAFWNAVRVTVVFVLGTVGVEVVLGVAVALALWRQRRHRAIAVGLLLLPWCLPGVVTARTFEWLYHPTSGLVNLVLGRSIDWLGDPRLALLAIAGADVWRTMPFVALLSYARLLTIPDDVFEAAAVDGAGRLRAFRAITLPLLLPVLLVTTLFRTLDALRVFDLPFVLTGGGPAATTETLTIYAYRSLFQTLQLGFGSAVAAVIFVLVVLTAAAYLAGIERAERGT